jgi:hypothetical protein
MKIYSYVITSDDGFAPNPFHGYCTLATCKPIIRRKAKRNDWVIGTGSVKNVGNDCMIYAMKVTEKLSLEDYAEDERFATKIPGDGAKRRVGDNIYFRDRNGITRQRFPSGHSIDRENPETKEHDLNGKNVLISRSESFYYFGENAPKIPKNLQYLIKKGPGHKCRFNDDIIKEFIEWIKKEEPGIHGKPCDYIEQSRCTRQRTTKCAIGTG